jgi:hypothetical protein
MPEDSSTDAQCGILAHYEAAKKLIEHGAVYSGGELPKPKVPASLTLGPWHSWAVDFYVETVLSVVPRDWSIEVEGEYSHEFPAFTLTGHPDSAAFSPDGKEVIIFDLKTGAAHVDEAEDNAQGAGYLTLAKKAYPDLRKATFVIVQPANNPDFGGRERISETTVEGVELDGLCNYLESELTWAAQHPNLFNSDHGHRQCRYCRVGRSGICPAINGDISLMKIELTDEAIASLALEPNNERLSALVLDGRKLAPIFEQAEAQLKARLTGVGTSCTFGGSTLVLCERTHHREITDTAAAVAALSDLPDALYNTTFKLQPAEIVRALAKHLDIPQKSKVPGKPTAAAEYERRLGRITNTVKCQFLSIQ